MQRVMILGISGSGKSTLADFIGRTYGLPVTHLDNVFHSPGWIARPAEYVQRDFDALAATDTWVVDGNFRKVSAALRERADVVIFLDFGRIYAIRQIVQRWAKHKLGLQRRADLGEGFNEQLPLSFLLWVWNWPKNNRPSWVEQVKELGDKAHTFHSRKAVYTWLKQQKAAE